MMLMTETTPLTVNEVAERLNVSRYTVIREIQRGKLEAERIGGQYRVREEALAQYRSNANTKKKQS